MRTLACLLLSLPLAATAEMYRWVDAKGKVHYSQVKPTGREFEKLAPAAPPVGAPAADRPAGGLAGYAAGLEKSNAETDQMRAQEAAAQEARRRRCGEARGGLRLQTEYEGRMFSINENGERQPWSAEQHAQARGQLETEIAENCQE